MASSINAQNNVLPTNSPTSLGGNASAYQEKVNGGAQQRGGQGYGFEGKSISPGVAEVSSYKGGKSKRRNSKRRQRKSRRQNKSRRQRKSRR